MKKTSLESLKIFIVEDDEWFGQLLLHTLALNPEHEVFLFKTAADCLQKLHLNPAIITVDYRLPDMNGIDLIKQIKEYNNSIEIITISGQETIDTAIDCIKEGASDYIVKTDDIRERLLLSVNNLLKKQNLTQQVWELKQELGKKLQLKHQIIGNSTPLKKVFELVEKAIQSNISVMISGETGTGKELIAKAIHYNSPFIKGKFVAVNVAAIPSELIESELFGHEKGAFTGAGFLRKGKVEEAHNGTLFLDEIAEMDLHMQAKILRVLQEREFVRIGANTPIKSTFRLIVASHQNLLERVNKGLFREDLYYRLFGLPIHLPPLRDRNTDILLLAKFFLDSFCKENNFNPKSFSLDAQQKLRSYPFPGNIRELKAIVELAAALSNEPQIQADEIQLMNTNSIDNLVLQEMSLKDYNDAIIKHFLNKYQNDFKVVAQKLNIGLSTLYKLQKEDRI